VRPPLRSVLFFLPAVTAAVGAACGSSGGSGGGTTTSASSSTSTTSSTSGATSTSTISTSTTTTTTTTTNPYACLGSQDMAVLPGTLTWPAEVNCVAQDGADGGALPACIAAATGVSPACAACIAEDLACSAQCQSSCAGAPTSQACLLCKQVHCLVGFQVCSGLINETGTLSCATVYGGGPTSNSWVTGLWKTFFTTAAGYAAYQAYDDCACNTCAPDCQVLHYCGGAQIASPPCTVCIQQQCAGQIADCQAN
jgi:hypothetical protein